MKALISVFLLSVLSLFTSCSTLPTPEKMKAEIAEYKLPMVPSTDKAMVYIVRPSGAGGLIRFNVFVDDQKTESEMGYTRGVQYIYFNVTPGPHKIYSVAENWAEIDIDAKPNEIIFIEQEATMGFFMARNNLLKLEDYQGKYHVKSLSLGTIIKTDK